MRSQVRFIVAIVVVALMVASYLAIGGRHPGARSGFISIAANDGEFHEAMPSPRVTFDPLTDPAEIRLATRRLEAAMSRYDRKFIESELDHVVLVKTLYIDGLPVGGTYSVSPSTVAISVQPVKIMLDWREIDRTFHHEFSSILLLHHQSEFPLERWCGANQPGFEYRSGGLEAVKSGQDDINLNESLFPQGILCQYSAASYEEDLNMFAQMTLSGDLGAYVNDPKYPRIHEKVKLLLGFYRGIGSGVKFSF